VNLRRLVHEGAPKLLAQLGRLGVAVLFDGMAHREGKDFLFGATNGDAAVALAGEAAAVDHFAGSVWHKDLEVVRMIEYYGRASVAQASRDRAQ
jgi:hypothetical protein